MPISAAEPVSRAWARMVQILFQPFNLTKWLVVGFCAFLATCGENSSFGGGGTNFSNAFSRSFTAPALPTPPAPTSTPTTMPVFPPGPATAPATQPAFPTTTGYSMRTFPTSGGPFNFDVWGWVRSNVALVVAIGIAALLLLALTTALMLWLKSRGRFMFIDNLAHNRPAVAEPWHRFAGLAHSLFLARLVLAAIGWVVILVGGGITLALAWPTISSGTYSVAHLLPLILVGSLLWLVLALVTGGLSFMLEQVIVPTMYIRRVPVTEAWQIVRAEVLPGNGGGIILFFLMRTVLNIAATIAIGILGCCSCCLLCIPSLPYLSTVFYLPVFVFLECYTLYFMEQFGPAFRIFADQGHNCSVCGYDLRGNPQATNCPECGAALPPPDLGPARFAPPSAPPPLSM